MSKRKKKVLHVDELVVKANKVIIVDEKDNDKKDKDMRKRKRRDPWDWSRKDDKLESSSFEKDESRDDDRKDSFSWW